MNYEFRLVEVANCWYIQRKLSGQEKWEVYQHNGSWKQESYIFDFTDLCGYGMKIEAKKRLNKLVKSPDSNYSRVINVDIAYSEA